jgi:YVTN family beta-propeller protein
MLPYPINGTKVYVANKGSNQVTVIDPATSLLAVKGAINIGTTSAAIVASADSNCVYVAGQNGTVTVINAGSDAIAGTITVGAGPAFLRFDPKLQRVYVANTGGSSISVINHATDCSANSATTVAVGPGPQSIAALSDGTRAYVANSDGSVTVINASGNTVRKTITVASASAFASIGSSADGTKVVVANSSGNVSVIRTSDDTVIPGVNFMPTTGLIPAAPHPQFVLMNP